MLVARRGGSKSPVLEYPRDTVGQYLHERAQMRIVIYDSSGRHVTLRVMSIVGAALEALVTLVWHKALRSLHVRLAKYRTHRQTAPLHVFAIVFWSAR